MTDAVTYLSTLELLIGGLCVLIASLAWGYRDRPAGTPLIVLALAAAGWAVGAGINSLVVEAGPTRAVQFAVYVLSGIATVAWFLAVVEHTGRDRLAGRPVRGVVAGLVTVDLLSVATDPWLHWYITADSRVGPQGLFDPTPGPLLWVNAAWKTGVVLVGLVLLAQQYESRQGLFSLQTGALAVAGVLAPAFAFVELLDLVPVPGFDLGVVGIATSALILLWALFYANLLSVAPIARRTLFENVDDAVLALDADGNVVEMNRRAMALFDAESDAIGRSAEAVFEGHPALDPGEPSTGDHTGAFTAELDGEPRHFELSTSPVFGPRTGDQAGVGDRIGTLLVFRDVTLRHERERDIERKNARLEEFASVVSHDLRNPLSVAQGYLDLARDTGDEADFAEVSDALDRMDELIEDLLVLAREGQSVQDTEPVDLAACVEGCWGNVPTDGATLTVATTRTVRADRSRVEQLLENLLRNAVEHGGDAVTVGDLDGTGFYVADDGPGIPPAHREVVFDYGHSSNPDGTGLGLAIVKEIAEAHGWSVRVTEGEDGGARFEFTGVESAA